MNGKTIYRLLLNWLASAFAVWLAAWILPGIEIENFRTALLVSLVLGLLNVIVRPILQLISLPLIVLTLGLFLWVINAVLLYFVGDILPGFSVNGFWPAVWGSLIISIVSSLFTRSRVSVKTGHTGRAERSNTDVSQD